MNTLECTEYGCRTSHMHGERWSSKVGFVINKEEHLCTPFATKRIGFKTLSAINAERKTIKS